jgi:hypothetical protein
MSLPNLIPECTHLIFGPPADTIALSTHPSAMKKDKSKYASAGSVSVAGCHSQEVSPPPLPQPFSCLSSSLPSSKTQFSML